MFAESAGGGRPKMKVTLHEVAARADVSIATVSRALNGLPVSEKNLARVREAVAELGYVANEAARALRSDRSMTMGIIFSDLRNNLGIDLLDALSDTLEEAGYSLLIATAKGEARRFDTLMLRFLERRVDALFLIRPPGALESLTRYEAAKVPVMGMFGPGPGAPAIPNISPAMTEGARELAEHLKGLGHERVALVGAERGNAALGGIGEVLRGQGLAVDAFDTPPGAGMAETLKAVVAAPARPSVILTRDPPVRGLMAAAMGLGMAFPSDISLVSLNEIGADSHHRRHGITSLTVDPHKMGKAAGATMLAWLAGSPPSERIRIQTAGLHVRGSTGPA